ncbi:reverse transcriptase family protein [Clostridium botulinum]|uniref:reverse transcriptase family protein n=1 Tax=Clostridium botulinum TaxID=1491 RepID=UPI00094746CD|nr:reverse transcriptase family protein [Clostridium botulinum]APQ77512.1 reverse transcriptase family protein [Clostridium botulinum]
MKVWKIENYDDYFNFIVKVSEDNINELLSQDEKKKYYSGYIEIKKKIGKRKIYCVDKDSKLFKLQKNIKSNFLDNIMLSDACYGFRKGYSYYDFLSPHKDFYSKKYFLRIDIKEFFNCIDYSIIEDVIKHYFVVGDNLTKSQKKKLIQYTLKAVTYRKKVIQGAITSPVLSNIIFRQLDLRIEKYCKYIDVIYTRYADDLLFSSYNRFLHSRAFINIISRILNSKGFDINYSKIIRARNSDKNSVSINGYVINDEIHLSRTKLKSLNRVLFYLENTKWKNCKNDFESLNKKMKAENDIHNFSGKYELVNFLTGYRAFIISIVKGTDDIILKQKYQKYIERIELLVKKLV